MATTQDKDVAIWVCPHGSSSDVKEIPEGTEEPVDRVCGSHGEMFIKQCPNPECSEPTYHPSDLDRRYHHCGEKIPWADSRAETARALMEYDTFNSRYLGRELPELTPEERQDLIVPPSERLPAQILRTPTQRKRSDPPSTPVRTTSLNLPDNWTDLLRQSPGSRKVRSTDVWVPPPMPKLLKTEPTTKWRRFSSGVGSFLFGSLQNFFGGLLLLLVVLVLAYFGVKLVTPQ